MQQRMEYLVWIESTAIATWVRESLSLWAYPTIIALHALGMAFLVGLNVAIDLRILGIAPELPLPPLEKFFRFMWWALGINAVSGTLLIMAYAEKMLTMPVFYFKLGFVIVAVVLLVRLKQRVFAAPESLADGIVPHGGKVLASTSLVFWAATLIAGRLTACPLLLAGN